MDIGSILLILGLLILVALYIGQPLLRRTALIVSEDEQEYSALLAERDRILNALQELDFDHTLGKIPDGVYPSHRKDMLQRGAAILQKIDEYHGETDDEDIDSRLEATIENRKGELGDKATQTMDDDDLEEMIANRRRARPVKSSGFCSQCGTPMQQSDRFCPKCGTKTI
jgi:NADH pyrophosphatase NudC (nudix superfamily)